MLRDPRAFLWDIATALGHIRAFVRERSLADYAGDVMLRSAVERQFEIVGEALAQLVKLRPDLVSRISDYRRIIDFRNRLIHGYATVSDQVVWGVITTDVAGLEREVSTLLAELDADSES